MGSPTQAGQLAEQWGGSPRDWAGLIRTVARDFQTEGACVTMIRDVWIADTLGPGDGIFPDLYVPSTEAIARAILGWSAERVWVALRVRLHLAGRDD